MKSCKDVTELISLSNEQKLTFNQHYALRFHLLFCPYCRAFRTNNKKLRQLILQFKQREESE